VKYFKNTELAKLYKVSEKTVRNWVQAAQESKLDLQLFDHKGKQFIANTSKNTSLIEAQVEKGKKFKNRRGFRVVSPTKEFYKLYSQKQILDIISNLTIHREIPTQYSYADGGAKYWDEYANRLHAESAPNILNQSIELLDATSDNTNHLVDGHKLINVVDLGPGNGLPIRSTLTRLLEQGRLKRYIAIDGSKEMLQILEQNIKLWFGGAVRFESYVRDFSYERFDDLLADDYIGDMADAPANLVFLLGNTLNNFRSTDQVLQTINNSLGVDDLFLYSCYLDTPNTRRYFDFHTSRLDQKFRSELTLGFLGIDESLYRIEQVFNEEKQARLVSFVPKVDLSIKFELANGARIVEIRKNEPILIWRGRHKNSVETLNQFDKNDFGLMQATKSKDQQYLLLISRIKTNV